VQTWNLTVRGDPVRVHRVETPEDLEPYWDFIRRNEKVVAFDTETTGLDIYSRGYRTRLAQFGNKHEGWVLPVETGAVFGEAMVKTLQGVDRIVGKNLPFDFKVVNQTHDVAMEDLWHKALDVEIQAKLIDPRAPEKGGIGISLEDLVRYYLDPELADEVKGSMSKLAKEYKTTKAKIFEVIPLDNPEYNIYAGMDTIFPARLSEIQHRLIPDSARHLMGFEHEIAEVCSYMDRTGFLLDVEYTQGLSMRLHEDEEKYTKVAARFGCENVNSTDQVAEVLTSRGVRLKDRTPTGRLKVDKTILDELIKKGDEFAIAVHEAKKARKWRTTWVDGFLNNMDANGRCHASTNTLQARTGRMSITGIPAQTLPASDWMIRRCFVADPDEDIVSVDYKGQELRVLAARSGDATMIDAFKHDLNLHLITAQAAFGDQVEKDSKEYKAGKITNFARVFGGGPKVVSLQTGLSFPQSKKVTDAFDARYPGVTRYAEKLAAQARTDGFITTLSGRRLPVDPDRAYSALNYDVQSSARDVTCRGVIKAHRQGFTAYMRLVLHDELLMSMPRKGARWGADRVAELMAEQMGPVFIDTDADVLGFSWGHAYASDEFKENSEYFQERRAA
jgi:DNA polymerase-1